MRPKARVVRSTVEAEYQAVYNERVPDMTGPYIQSAQVPSLADMDGDQDQTFDPSFESCESSNATPEPVEDSQNTCLDCRNEEEVPHLGPEVEEPERRKRRDLKLLGVDQKELESRFRPLEQVAEAMRSTSALAKRTTCLAELSASSSADVIPHSDPGVEKLLNKFNQLSVDETDQSGIRLIASSTYQSPPMRRNLFCCVCDMYLHNEDAYQDHLEGKMHRDKVRAKRSLHETNQVADASASGAAGPAPFEPPPTMEPVIPFEYSNAGLTRARGNVWTHRCAKWGFEYPARGRPHDPARVECRECLSKSLGGTRKREESPPTADAPIWTMTPSQMEWFEGTKMRDHNQRPWRGGYAPTFCGVTRLHYNQFVIFSKMLEAEAKMSGEIQSDGMSWDYGNRKWLKEMQSCRMRGWWRHLGLHPDAEYEKHRNSPMAAGEQWDGSCPSIRLKPWLRMLCEWRDTTNCPIRQLSLIHI